MRFISLVHDSVRVDKSGRVSEHPTELGVHELGRYRVQIHQQTGLRRIA